MKYHVGKEGLAQKSMKSYSCPSFALFCSLFFFSFFPFFLLFHFPIIPKITYLRKKADCSMTHIYIVMLK